MKSGLHWVACWTALFAGVNALAVNPAHFTISTSKQFIVYCDDVSARFAVSAFAEKTKADLLALLGEKDQWKYPIVINIEQAEAFAPGRPVSEVKIFEIEDGFKVGINVWLRDDLSKLRFHHDLAHALLLEFMYRSQPVKADREYFEPPPWLIAGLCKFFETREPGANAEVFKAVLEAGRVPPIKDFLAQNASNLDATSQKFYDACALSLVELLAGLPNGRASLAAYVRSLSAGPSDPVASLKKHFPTLADSQQSIEKWWVLSMARISASDRYLGLSIEETDKQLSALLKLRFTIKKEVKIFELSEYEKFLKLPETREILKVKDQELRLFSGRAHAMFLPVVVEYQQVLADLQRRRTRNVPERLSLAAKSRERIVSRLTAIADYMNWFEATQITKASEAFTIRSGTATELSAGRPDPISRYMDAMELEYK